MAEEPRPLAYYIWPFHIYTLAEGIMISGSLAAAECHAHINAHKPPAVCVRVQLFMGQSIGIDETNTFQLKFFFNHENSGRHSFGRFLNLKSQFYIFDSFRDIRVYT